MYLYVKQNVRLGIKKTRTNSSFLVWRISNLVMYGAAVYRKRPTSSDEEPSGGKVKACFWNTELDPNVNSAEFRKA